MTDDYKRGLVTGLAMQPLYVTTGADIVKFGTHNLLTDSGVVFGTEYTDFSVSGEVCTCTAKEYPLNATPYWYKAISGLSFKPGYMYKITASEFNGYGRFGITNKPGVYPHKNVGTNAYGSFKYDPVEPSGGDNQVLRYDWQTSQFYIGMISSSATVSAVSGEFWWCTDLMYNDAKAAHSFQIALYEEVKS